MVMLDAPETIKVAVADPAFATAQNTYLMTVPIPAATIKKFRLYFWHKAGDNDYELKIFAKLTTGGTATISGIKLLAISEPNDLAGMGRCLAKAHLYGTIPDGGSPISLSGSESLIFSSSIAEGVTLGGVMEFNVAGTLGSPVDLQLREMIKPDGATDCDDTKPVVSPAEPGVIPAVIHCRGWWPQSAVHLKYGPIARDCRYDNTSLPPTFIGEFKCGIHACGTGKPFSWQGLTLDPHGTQDGLKGLYGVNGKYTFRLSNTSSENTSAQLYVKAPQVNGAIFTGAARLIGGAAMGVLPLKNLIDLEVSQVGAVLVPANTSSLEVTVEHAVGGASSFPIVFAITHSIPS